MFVEIPGDYNAVMQELISGGGFRDEREVVVAGLRLLQARESVRKKVQEGFDQLDAGKLVDAEEVYARARRRIDEFAKAKSAGN